MPSTVMLCSTLNKDIWSILLLLRVNGCFRLSFLALCLWGPPWASTPTPEKCDTLLSQPCPHQESPMQPKLGI